MAGNPKRNIALRARLKREKGTWRRVKLAPSGAIAHANAYTMRHIAAWKGYEVLATGREIRARYTGRKQVIRRGRRQRRSA